MQQRRRHEAATRPLLAQIDDLRVDLERRGQQLRSALSRIGALKQRVDELQEHTDLKDATAKVKPERDPSCIEPKHARQRAAMRNAMLALHGRSLRGYSVGHSAVLGTSTRTTTFGKSPKSARRVSASNSSDAKGRLYRVSGLDENEERQRVRNALGGEALQMRCGR